jgi:Zn-dependent membrane protease YugP
MENYLLYVSSFVIFFSFLLYLLMIIFGNKKVSDEACFGVLLDELFNYDGIKIVLSKGKISYYDLKRKVIKLTEKCYYGNSVSSFSVMLTELGYFVSDKNNNKFVKICSKILPMIKMLYILPFISIFLSFSIFSYPDSVVGALCIVLFISITFLLIDVKKQTISLVKGNAKTKEQFDVENVISFMNRILLLDYCIIFGEMILLFRFILLMGL